MTLGRYKAIASLGQGGMAQVYLALMSGPAGFNKLLVLKVLREDLEASREDLVAMFLDEARLAARMSHRCIVQTYEVGEAEGRCFIAMEYLEGQPLRAVQRRLAPSGLPVADELRVLAETAHALHYAHELRGFDDEPLSVVHRDVSPQNVFVTYDGQVKLLDFGIAKTDVSQHLTKVGTMKGKVDYIAPEQVRGEKVDRRADIFSLGVMLWEALTGRRFAGGKKVAEFTKIHTRLTGGEPKIRDVRPDVPEVLASLVDDALALDPAQRLPTAALFAARIEKYLATLPEKPTDQTLAAALAPRFREDRANLRKLIDQRIQLLQEQGRMLGSIPPASSSLRPLDFGMTASSFLDLTHPSASGQSALASSQQGPLVEPVPLASRRKVPLIAGAVLLLAGVATTIALVSAKGGGAPTSAVGVAASTPSAGLQQPMRPDAPSPVLASKTVRVKIAATPATARATLDGAPLELPFTGTFQASDAMHHLEISARGYETVRKLVTFEEDRDLSVTLQRTPPAVRARPKRPAPAPKAASAPAATDADEQAPGSELKTGVKTRRFDMTDPYAN